MSERLCHLIKSLTLEAIESAGSIPLDELSGHLPSMPEGLLADALVALDAQTKILADVEEGRIVLFPAPPPHRGLPIAGGDRGPMKAPGVP